MHRVLLRVEALAKSYGWHDIFRNIHFELAEGEKAAIVGPNGIGKTTLLRIIAGLTPPSAGSCTCLQPGAVIGFLPQEPELPAPGTTRSVLAAAHAALGAAARFSVSEAMGLFGFTGSEADLPVAALSGGQKTRLALARLWLSLPDLLILDEPTNHIDQEGLAWLEAAVVSFPHTVLCVSHDRYFLDKTAQRILELRADGIQSYAGNYSAYRQAKQEAYERQMQRYIGEQKEVRRIEEALDRQMRWFQYAHHHAGQNDFYRARAKKMAARAKSTVTRLERAKDSAVAKPRPEAAIQLDLAAEGRGGTRLYLAEGIGKAYERLLFRDGNFAILRGDKIGLVGPNGAGKTTLLNMLLGTVEPSWGSIWRSPALQVGYLEQEMQRLDQEQTLLESVLAMFPARNAETRQRTRALLAAFLFRPPDLEKKLGVLSYGEQRRVALIRLLIGAQNTLLLDEPTNHLDLPAREKLEEALLAYDGTLVLVSHDRYLLQKVCTKILAIRDCSLYLYPGSYDEYLQSGAGNPAEGHRIDGTAAEKGDRLLLAHRLAVLAGRLSAGQNVEQRALLEAEYIAISRSLQRK